MSLERADAERSEAEIKVEEITKDFEPVGFRVAGQVADSRGAGYEAYRIVTVFANGHGELWLCVAPEDHIWRVFTWVEELGGWDSYKLEKGKEYQARFRIRGKFKPVEWRFTLSVDDESKLSYTEPKKV